MAYQVDKFNGTFLVSVDDGTIDTTTDLRFVGKNYAGYGEIQNENFLFLMENFANLTPPPKAIEGQIWYDSGTKKLKFYDGIRFKVTTGAETGAIAPTGLTIGEMWWDTSTKQLYVWSGSEYELVGPEASPELGQTSVTSMILKDDQTPVPQTHPVVAAIVGGKIVSIVSASEFTIGDEDTITGFTRIKKGITLVGTPADGNQAGVSYPIDHETGEPTDTSAFLTWGTASDALKLGGLAPSSYLLSTDVNFDQNVHFQSGYSLGGLEKQSAGMWVEPDGIDVVFNNRFAMIDDAAETIFRISSQNETYKVAFIDMVGLNPGLNGSIALNIGYELGKDDLRWKTIYADLIDAKNISGDITGDTSGNHFGNVISVNPLTNGLILVNALTNIIGFEDLTIANKTVFHGNLIGNVQGDVTGNASNAQKLANYEPHIYVPTTPNKESAVIRDSNGRIYATEFVGVSNNANKLKIDDVAVDPGWNPVDETTFYRAARTTKTAYSIAARDSAGNISANIFNGTATSAQFADLAEKYLTDKEYDIGTVIVVGGKAEVTASKLGDRAIGVVSNAPAYMMNCDLEGGTYIALKGRTPVKVIGEVKKGQQLIADNNGCASVGIHDSFAIALESSNDVGVKLIESVIL